MRCDSLVRVDIVFPASDSLCCCELRCSVLSEIVDKVLVVVTVRLVEFLVKLVMLQQVTML